MTLTTIRARSRRTFTIGLIIAAALVLGGKLLYVPGYAQNDVLLSLLGVFSYSAKYPNGAPGQQVNSEAGAVKFTETGHTLGGKFLEYWKSHGGLAQQGFPISDEFTEVSDLNGQPYTVQYFERAVFEMHPENKPPFDVLLSQLGTFRFAETHQAAQPTPTSPVSNPSHARTTPRSIVAQLP